MESITVKISRVGSQNSDLALPQYMTDHASGLDLYAAVSEDTILNPGERRLIPTGIALAIPPGYEAQIRQRSGLAVNHGMTVITPGTIDADYRGEISVVLMNISDKDFTVQDGERICQMVIAKHEHAEWESVEILNDSDRGTGGFGHTGIK